MRRVVHPFLFLLATGCTPAALRLAEEPIDDAVISAVFPPDGARRLEGDVPVHVVLGGGAEAVTRPGARAELDGGALPLQCLPRIGATFADCDRIAGLTRDAVDAVDVVAWVGTEEIVGHATTRLPDGESGWDLLAGATIDRLGGGDTARDLVADALDDDSTVVAVLHDWDQETGSGTLLLGSAQPAWPGAIEVKSPGLTTLLDATVDEDGNLRGQADRAWLSLRVAGEPVNLLLLDVVFEARVEPDALTDLVLEADLPALSLVLLTDPLGEHANKALHLVDLDLDRNGDGRADAASLRISGFAPGAALAAWDTTSR